MKKRALFSRWAYRRAAEDFVEATDRVVDDYDIDHPDIAQYVETRQAFLDSLPETNLLRGWELVRVVVILVCYTLVLSVTLTIGLVNLPIEVGLLCLLVLFSPALCQVGRDVTYDLFRGE